MLELKDIKKTYETAGETVEALRGINLKFRENEFVSILGPSGCGKTTMLNIIGGLDKYTSGDLVINGKSTKEYNDRDWDTYRNHSIGFVFQTYNLIPHQTVLQNVELALTLSGVGKAERRKRAKEALERVGLGNQLKKRPSQMSGGQMQRVAIARAIVNNPDIVLADEPTGALDTETSIQVMDILKEIAKDRLVIMVTHNPELADRYSTRIVKMLDGSVKDDSMPLTDEEIAEFTRKDSETAEAAKKKKEKKPSMSFATSFGLSLKNLFTKKSRTLLTSFAGSIGIIGIALIYAVSQGTTNYINNVQEETLSSYPLTIQASSVDISSLITTYMGKAESIDSHENDAVYQKAMIYNMINAYNSVAEQKNDLKTFKKYIEDQRNTEGSIFAENISAVKYKYDVDLTVYTKNIDGKIILADTEKLTSELMKKYMGTGTSSSSSGQYSGFSMAMMMGGSSSNLWTEMIPGENGSLVSDVTKKQYDLVYGDWPTSYDQVVIFIDEKNEIDDLTLYALGLKTEEDIAKIMEAAANKAEIEYTAQKWTYEEICGLEFKTVLDCDCYVYDDLTGTYTDLRDTETGLSYLYENGMKLKVVGIVKPNENAVSSSSDSGIGYTGKLMEYIISHSSDAAIVKAQKANPNTDVLTGLPFKPSESTTTDAQKAAEFKAYVATLDDSAKAKTYIKVLCIPSDEQVQAAVDMQLGNMSREEMEQTFIQMMTSQTGMGEAEISAYISAMSDEEIKAYFEQIIAEQFKAQYAQQVMQQAMSMTSEQMLAAFDAALSTYTDEQAAKYYDEILEFSKSTYDENLTKFGAVDIDSPTGISIYSSTFAGKDAVKNGIEDYNKTVDDLKQISYTDYVGLMMSSITTIINAITYVLIAFVAVSLIVSSIMIGVITLISVQERTKEIGILRAIGASKKNVSGMFNAETVIIGFTSGLLGVVITWLLCIPINLILHKLTGIMTLSAVLPIPTAIILIVISMLLTLIAGIIPSRSAAKKDPVVALRTE